MPAKPATVTAGPTALHTQADKIRAAPENQIKRYKIIKFIKNNRIPYDKKRREGFKYAITININLIIYNLLTK